jgi:lysophospholipase L1-like esterase
MSHLARTEQMEPFRAKLRNRQPTLLLTLGDSNTSNADFSGGAKQWPELLHTALKERFGYEEILLINAGMCGDTAQDAGRRLERDVLRFKPDLVMVCFGTNDRRLDVATFRTELSGVCQRIRETGSGLLLRTTLPILEQNPPPPHWWKSDHDLRERLDVVRELAQSEGYALYDTYAAWLEAEATGGLVPADLMCDDIHSNAAGHHLVFTQLLELFPAS